VTGFPFPRPFLDSQSMYGHMPNGTLCKNGHTRLRRAGAGL